jgi:hypothetical protein
MTTRRAIRLMLALLVLNIVVDGWFWPQAAGGHKPLDLLWWLGFTSICYLWYRQDAVARNHPSSLVLGAAVVGLSVLAIPFYLVKSREPGQRARAVWRYVRLALLSMLVSGLAAAAVEWIRPA